MSTSDVAGSAVAVHSATCADCARVLQAITDADRMMMQERDESYFTTSPDEVAKRAVLLGQRRRVFGGVSVVAVALAGFSVWYAIASLGQSNRARFAARDQGVTESFAIRCLSKTNVRELLAPYMRTGGSQLSITQPPLRVFTVRTTQAEMAQVREVLQRFDTPENGNCQVPDATPAATPDVPAARVVPADAAPARLPDVPPPPA